VVTNIQDKPFVVDAMTLEDIPAVMAIEKTAFPIPWPEQAYRHELLENQNAYFIVVRSRQAADGNSNGRAPGPLSLFQRLTAITAKPAPRAGPIVGFAGMWMFVDEAHVSTIASHADWRGHGVGEMLLLALLREAQRRDAIFATLEVRVTNYVAQKLYLKYGFVEVGRRKRYYRDNNEDALIMTVQNFREPIYKAQLDVLERRLMERLTQKGGIRD
jgi:[ribosomal protein S18]-alanine N-acetyltransferase